MDPALVTAICNQVYRKFPEVAGAKPRIQSRPEDQTLLIFQGSAQAADGRTLPRTVRVVADARGKILKMTTSR